MKKHKMNKYRRLERTVKGFSNHRRIQIIELLHKKPELSLADISGNLRINVKTASEHTRRLAIAGLVLKRSSGKAVRHKLSDKGLFILTFLRTLE